MKRYYVDTPEGQIHYQTDGSGEPLLLLHMAGSSSNQFIEMIPILAKSYWVIVMDILGCGKSDMPPATYRIEDYALNTIHFLDALHIKKPNVVGRLTGAAIAVEMAAVYPDRVDKLVLQAVDYMDPEGQRQKQEFYKNEAMRIKADGSHLIEWWKERLSRPHMTPELAHRALCDYLEAGQGLRAEDRHRALFAYNFDTKLPLIKSPTLVVWGQGDRRLERMEPTRKLIPRCRSKVIEGAWNYPTWTKPVELSDVIIEFFKNPGV